MTDNELKKWNKEAEDRIIKALECFAIDKDFDDTHCIGCAFEHQFCTANMSYDIAKLALSLINRQKAEMENYSHNNRTMTNSIRKMQKIIESQKAEIERLTNHIQEGIDLAKQIPEMIALAQAEAIKEFAEMAKGYSLGSDRECECRMKGKFVFVSDIERIAKEMVGEEDG